MFERFNAPDCVRRRHRQRPLQPGASVSSADQGGGKRRAGIGAVLANSLFRSAGRILCSSIAAAIAFSSSSA
jgi:hypothetical protein